MSAEHKQPATLVPPATEFVVDPVGHAVQPVEVMYVLAKHKQLATLVPPTTEFVVDPVGHAVQTVAPVEVMYVLAKHKLHEVAALVEAE